MRKISNNIKHGNGDDRRFGQKPPHARPFYLIFYATARSVFTSLSGIIKKCKRISAHTTIAWSVFYRNIFHGTSYARTSVHLSELRTAHNGSYNERRTESKQKTTQKTYADSFTGGIIRDCGPVMMCV